jgi:glycosyltransferase involved in cell wall biosynthesis
MAASDRCDSMVILVIVPFLNEEQYLPVLLGSIAGQTRVPDCLVLVDDGSSDDSPAVAREYAARNPYAQVLHRPPRPASNDRLASASEWAAWQWALAQTTLDADLLVKLDADLRLPPRFFEEMERQFLADPVLGLAGAHLSTLEADGVARRERNSAGHVRGATKFYRAHCYRDISPIPNILGWDTIDEVAARLHGWRTANVAIPGGDPVHLRMTGTYDGRLRGYRRRGAAAYGYGAHPWYVALGGVRRMADRPYGLAGINYVLGWARCWLGRAPRAAPELRASVRREHARSLARLFGSGR